MRDIALIIHFIGLAMGLGTSFAFMFLGKAAQKMEPTERAPFMGKVLVLSRMGHIGITLLFLSGIYLIVPYADVLLEMPLLLTKLILFVILGALVGILSKTGKRALAGDPSQFLKMAKIGRFSMLTSLIIVVLAVLVFH